MPQKKYTLSKSEKKDSIVLGITAHVDEFTFCTLLQQELSINLRVSEQVEFEIRPNTRISYPIYSYQNTEQLISYELVSNKTKEGHLIDFLENISFFLRCTSEYIESGITEIQSSIKNIEAVLFVQQIEHGKYSQKQRAKLRTLFPYI